MSVYETLCGDHLKNSALIQGVVVGIVTENDKKEMPGYVRVQIPVRDEEMTALRWAKVASPYCGKDWGQYFMPEIGDMVLLAFEHGSLEHTYVIASLPRDNDTFTANMFAQQNQKKRIATRHGSGLEFVDVKDTEGEKDRLSIFTSDMGRSFVMDNEKQKTVLTDKEGKCRIEMQAEKGELHLYAENKIVIHAGDSVTITLNGANKTVKIDADQLDARVKNALELHSQGSFKADGAQVSVKASAMLREESEGMTVITGTPVKLG